MEKEYSLYEVWKILQDYTNKDQNRLTDTDLLHYLERITDVAVKVKEKEDDLIAEKTAIQGGVGRWPDIEFINRGLNLVERITKLLQEKRPELYATYYYTDEQLKKEIDFIDQYNKENAELEGFRPIQPPTKEGSKIVLPVGYWTKEQIKRYGYTIKKDNGKKKTMNIDKAFADRLIRAGLLDNKLQPTAKSRSEQAVLAHYIAEEMNTAKGFWNTFSSLWGVSEGTLKVSYHSLGIESQRKITNDIKLKLSKVNNL